MRLGSSAASGASTETSISTPAAVDCLILFEFESNGIDAVAQAGGMINQRAGGSTQLSAISWFKIHPKLQGHQISGADIREQGYVASAGNFLFYPAIQAFPGGSAAMVFTISGPAFFGSTGLCEHVRGRALLRSDQSRPSRNRPLRSSSNSLGRFSWAILDPNGKSFWLATEYIPPVASQTPDGLRNWGTRVLEVDATRGG